MYSLIITVRSINALYANMEPLTRQYSDRTEANLNHGKDYVIPSLIWPPPHNCVTTYCRTMLILRPLQWRNAR